VAQEVVFPRTAPRSPPAPLCRGRIGEIGLGPTRPSQGELDGPPAASARPSLPRARRTPWRRPGQGQRPSHDRSRNCPARGANRPHRKRARPERRIAGGLRERAGAPPVRQRSPQAQPPPSPRAAALVHQAGEEPPQKASQAQVPSTKVSTGRASDRTAPGRPFGVQRQHRGPAHTTREDTRGQNVAPRLRVLRPVSTAGRSALTIRRVTRGKFEEGAASPPAPAAADEAAVHENRHAGPHRRGRTGQGQRPGNPS